jgi:hypothetical protein
VDGSEQRPASSTRPSRGNPTAVRRHSSRVAAGANGATPRARKCNASVRQTGVSQRLVRYVNQTGLICRAGIRNLSYRALDVVFMHDGESTGGRLVAIASATSSGRGGRWAPPRPVPTSALLVVLCLRRAGDGCRDRSMGSGVVPTSWSADLRRGCRSGTRSSWVRSESA